MPIDGGTFVGNLILKHRRVLIAVLAVDLISHLRTRKAKPHENFTHEVGNRPHSRAGPLARSLFAALRSLYVQVQSSSIHATGRP
jgi:hypothetical protein